jgi:hypothetical protein
MLGISGTCRHLLAVVRLSVLTAGLVVGVAAAQDSPSPPSVVPGASAIRPGRFGSGTASGSVIPAGETPSGGIRRITLEQIKQSANRAASPLATLNLLTIEAARQHRLGVQADYFPKFGATFVNLHYTDFLGNVMTIRRPLMGTVQQVPVPLFSQNQTFAALTFVQPITPLFQVRQAVRIARADERIAMAKAGGRRGEERA